MLPDQAWVGVNNLSYSVIAISRVDGHPVLLAAAVGQAARLNAALAAWLCITPSQSETFEEDKKKETKDKTTLLDKSKKSSAGWAQASLCCMCNPMTCEDHCNCDMVNQHASRMQAAWLCMTADTDKC